MLLGPRGLVGPALLLTALMACSGQPQESETGTPPAEGMVLKPTDGEAVFGGATLIKASPRTGTQGTELFWSELGIGFSTGIHIHSRADEFFYVVSGTGIALVGGREVEIAPGDFVFVPKGSDHRIRTSGGGPLTIIYWVDRPGLADEFRDAHFASDGGKIALTLEELNRITQKYGTTYKTLE